MNKHTPEKPSLTHYVILQGHLRQRSASVTWLLYVDIYYVCPLLFGINGLFKGDNCMENLRSICVCMKCPQVKQLSWTFKAVWIRNYTNVDLSKAITLQSSVRQAQFYSLTVENKWIFQKNVLWDFGDLVAGLLLYLWWYVMSHRLASFSVL